MPLHHYDSLECAPTRISLTSSAQLVPSFLSAIEAGARELGRAEVGQAQVEPLTARCTELEAQLQHADAELVALKAEVGVGSWLGWVQILLPSGCRGMLDAIQDAQGDRPRRQGPGLGSLEPLTGHDEVLASPSVSTTSSSQVRELVAAHAKALDTAQQEAAHAAEQALQGALGALRAEVDEVKVGTCCCCVWEEARGMASGHAHNHELFAAACATNMYVHFTFR